MTAICKTINIHGGLSRLLDYGANERKTSLVSNDLQHVLEYAQNPLKTILDLDDGDKSMLVTGVLCSPETAEQDFSFAREKYTELNGPEFTTTATIKDKKTDAYKTVQKQPLTAVHLIQSFAEEDVDPMIVHQIGIELCERMGWQAVVDTHMNTGHYHNHIIINAYLPDGQGKVSMKQSARMRIRQMSDDIQREYGLEITFPEPQLQQQKKYRTLNYREWDMMKKSHSWKDQIRSDMLAARHVSTTKEDFISVMKAYGYSIERQTESSILWWNKTHSKKIWDRTLGEKYRLDRLLENEEFSAPYLTEQVRQEVRNRAKFISVARYSWDGRRRSDLELLIRRAISVIQHISAFYGDASETYEYHAGQKLSFMNEALDTMEAYGIESEDDLKQQLHRIGASLNHAKSEIQSCEASLNYYDALAGAVFEYESAKAVFDSVQYWRNPYDDLFPNEYSPPEVRKNRAGLSPATPKQKRDLYLAMKQHPDYHLLNPEKGYANISSVEAEAVLRFFQGKDIPPDILIPINDPSSASWESPADEPKPPPSDRHNRMQTASFQRKIRTETPGKQHILIRLRNRHNTLLSLGYDPASIDDVKQEISAFYARLDDLKKVRLDYSAKYKELIRLRQMTHNAKSEPYLYGQALSKTHPAPENSPTPAKEKVPDKAPPQKNLQLHISKDISPDGEIPL